MADGSVRLVTGQLSWGAGVDSSRVTTIASQRIPDGLPQNALSWANNCGQRGGGITQRTGWKKLCRITDSAGLYNGGWMYQQTTALPYLITAISGQFYRIRVDTDNSIDNITQGNVFPADQPLYHFTQGMEFMVAQAGDYVTNPLFWDGTTMRQSNGITGNVAQPGSTVRNFTVVDFFKIPAVAGTRVVSLSSIYPGVNGEQGVLRGVGGQFDIGTFTIMAHTLVAPFTVTIRTDTSNYIGHNFPPSNYEFTLTAAIVPVLINELPPAGPMVYYQGRFWYANYQIYTAGDIAGGPSGSNVTPTFYQLRDSVLKVTENPLAIGGDGFLIPSQSGNIRALQYVANNDANLGEGTLFIFTRQQVYALDVPITRTDWIAADSNSPPHQRVVQRNNGGVSDRSIVAVNGDLFYQSLEPGIRSLFTALRSFSQWGNTPISNNINRALAFNNRELMRFSTGVEFDARMYQGILPEQRPQGVVHRAIAPLDFDPVATMGAKTPPNWEGIHEGLDILQLFNGDFGGRERMFAVVVSKEDSGIDLWEITNDLRYDNIDTRVDWYVEFPAFTWGREFDMKKLDGGELWLDKLYGTVMGKVWYRVDSNPCWQLWHIFQLCTARSSCEDVHNPICYPAEVFRESGKIPIQFPVPPLAECNMIDARPMNIGHQFQIKLELSGWCRVRGLLVYATPFLKAPFGSLDCMPSPFSTNL